MAGENGVVMETAAAVERPRRNGTWRWLGSGKGVVALLAAAKLALHLATATVYGPFIDELYFLASGEHLAFGYVDFPPLTALQAWLAKALFGDWMVGIRLLPALAGAGSVLLTGALVRELGGRRFAQALAAFAVGFSPGLLAFDSYLSMNSVEPLLWGGCALVLMRLVRTGNTRLWLAFGALAGIGLENKHTILLFGFAIMLGLLLTPARRLMASRHFVIGGAIALLIFLPNLIWMIQHGFPHLDLLANIRRNGRDVGFSPLGFLALQAFFVNPAAVPLWLAGLWRFLVAREGRSLRALGLAYLIALGVLLAVHGKVYYLGPIYPVLLAAGAVSAETWLARPRRRWVRPAYAALVVAVAALLAPTFLPCLPPETYIRYTELLHVNQPRLENRQASALPQFFADRCGWREMAETVAAVYASLPPEERARTVIIGNDYGQCGAIDFYGPSLGLPKSVGVHLSYWLWGPRGYSGETAITLGDHKGPDGADQWFESVEEVADVGHVYAMRQEHFKVLLCRRPKGWTLEDLWPRLKTYD